jgi:hypothetical protein
MPACRQCGKENPAGTVYCGHCAAPLPTPQQHPADPLSSPPRPPPLKPLKPEIRTPISTPTAEGKDKSGGFEWIPWAELTSGQKGGRTAAAVIVLFLIFFFIRGILRGVATPDGSNEPAPAAQSSNPPMTEGDRKDGIESLCKVFQIYGMPKNDHDAAEAARNAAELFKLAGNQSSERSAFILAAIVQEFRGGKLKQTDCAEAGAPVGMPEENTNTDNSPPDINR